LLPLWLQCASIILDTNQGEKSMSFNLHIPTSVAEVKALAEAAKNAASNAAHQVADKAVQVEQAAVDKAKEASAKVAAQIPTVTITKNGSNT
jgi:hypothetical protein